MYSTKNIITNFKISLVFLLIVIDLCRNEYIAKNIKVR